MKYTAYEQIKNATEQELIEIDPDDYTDEEHNQILDWMSRAALEKATDEELLDMDLLDIHLCGLSRLPKDLITESAEEQSINGKKVLGRKVVDYPNFYIIREEGTNNFYKVMK